MLIWKLVCLFANKLVLFGLILLLSCISNRNPLVICFCICFSIYYSSKCLVFLLLTLSCLLLIRIDFRIGRISVTIPIDNLKLVFSFLYHFLRSPTKIKHTCEEPSFHLDYRFLHQNLFLLYFILLFLESTYQIDRNWLKLFYLVKVFLLSIHEVPKTKFASSFLGWTGPVCDIETNECMSDPCQNGAVCIDLHADYVCACPFGKYNIQFLWNDFCMIDYFI